LTVLDDAYFFLNQAKGRPDVPSIRPLLQRYIRACILSSWIALEETLDYAIDDLKKSGTPAMLPNRSLRDKIKAVLELRGAARLDSALFNETRAIRNSLVHPTKNTSEGTLLTVEQATKVLDFSYQLIRAIYPYSVTLRKTCKSKDMYMQGNPGTMLLSYHNHRILV
jgi:hypothetical protein